MVHCQWRQTLTPSSPTPPRQRRNYIISYSPEVLFGPLGIWCSSFKATIFSNPSIYINGFFQVSEDGGGGGPPKGLDFVSLP